MSASVELCWARLCNFAQWLWLNRIGAKSESQSNPQELLSVPLVFLLSLAGSRHERYIDAPAWTAHSHCVWRIRDKGPAVSIHRFRLEVRGIRIRHSVRRIEIRTACAARELNDEMS